MRTILTRIFSVLLAAGSVASMMAEAPQSARKINAAPSALTSTVKRQVTAKPGRSRVNLLDAKTRSVSTSGLRTSLPTTLSSAPARLPIAKSAASAELCGMVVYNDDAATSAFQGGVYTIPTNADQTFELVFAANDPAATYGAVAYNGVYYTSDYQNLWGIIQIFTQTAYDMESGEVLWQANEEKFDNLMLASAIDPTTNTPYAITFNSQGNGYQLSTLEFGEGVINSIAVAELPAYGFCAMGFTSQGQLYAIVKNRDDDGNATASFLVKVDKTTGAVDQIGETGILPQYVSGAVIDPKTDKMYWAISDAAGAGYMTEVNLTSGAAEVIYQFPKNDEVVGLYIPAPAAEAGAPAAAYNLSANFPEGSLTGSIKFDVPTTLYDGTETSGAVAYKVMADGNIIDEGNTTYGTKGVEVEYTAAAPAEIKFTVVLSNSVGDSPKANLKTFVGHGVPGAPAVSAILGENNKVDVSWTAVTSTIDGGYINPDEVTYTVTRYPGEVVVASALKDTKYSETLEEPSELVQYYYTVEADNAGLKSAIGKSNTITLGSVIPPYTQTFDTDLGGFTTEDVNADGKTWTWYQQAVRIGYNSKLAMDDYLFSVPMKLQGGKMYKVNFKSYCNGSSFPERLEVKYGKAATSAAMTETLLDATVIDQTQVPGHDLEGYLLPDADGIYYIGFHGISDADKFYLYIDDVQVSAAMSAEAPAAVSNLTATGAENAVKKITVKFTTPDKAISGAAITSLSKVEVKRDGVIVKTFDAPAVATELEYVDELEKSGTYTYTVVAYNAEGAGLEASADAFCGIDAPVAPETVEVIELTTPGYVAISWTAVTTDVRGTALNSADVKYDLYDYSGEELVLIAENLSTIAYTTEFPTEGKQQFAQYAVFAKTESGQGKGTASNMIPVGPAYDGLDESFTGADLKYIWAISTTSSNSNWSLANDSKFTDLTSCDGDDGFIYNQAQYLDEGGSLMSGKISLASLTAPALSFYTYNIVGEDGTKDINEIAVSVKVGNGEYEEVLKGTVDGLCNGVEGWGKVIVPLNKFMGKDIQIKFTVTVKQFTLTTFDIIKVADLVDYDLVAKSISAPSTVVAGSDYTVDVTVVNEGGKTASDYTVELYANGEMVESVAGPELTMGQSDVVTFNRSMSPLAVESITYSAKVVYSVDMNNDNNSTSEIIVTPKVSNMPKVNDLAAEATNAGVKLTWSEPDLSSAPADPETIDFEDGESFAQEYADWTFVDGDGSPVGGFQGSDIPGITPGTSLASYFVFDASYEQFNQTFAAHSGNKYLAALFRYDDGTSDDWAISPILADGGQTISFYARSYSANYPEKIQVCYSTGSTDPADFEVLETIAKVPGEWTLVEVQLPANAKRFAINSCATSSFMLMIDDVTFIPGNKFADVNIIGYNIYRNGEKLNAEPEAECEYIDANAPAGDLAYVVTVVYDKGESAASNEATISFSSLDDIISGLSISTEPGKIIVKGAEGIDVIVVATDGKVLYSAKGDATIATLPGIYVVKAGQKVVKVAVK